MGLGSVVHSTSDDKGLLILNSGILVTVTNKEKNMFKTHDEVLEKVGNTSGKFKEWLFMSEARNYSRKTKVKLSNALYRTVMNAALLSAKLYLRHIFKTQ